MVVRTGRKRTFSKAFYALLPLLAVAISIWRTFHFVVVDGHSMEPTFKDGQRVLVSDAYWLIGPIRHNDIVVVQDSIPGAFIIKRVCWLGGEDVDWINWPTNYSLKNASYRVPQGMLYVLGDNRKVSADSRSFGPIDVGKVLGKVVVLR
jgi:signal peptidase I